VLAELLQVNEELERRIKRIRAINDNHERILKDLNLSQSSGISKDLSEIYRNNCYSTMQNNDNTNRIPKSTNDLKVKVCQAMDNAEVLRQTLSEMRRIVDQQETDSKETKHQEIMKDADKVAYDTRNSQYGKYMEWQTARMYLKSCSCWRNLYYKQCRATTI